jgi:phosphoribosyl-AMP cyclohydrolase
MSEADIIQRLGQPRASYTIGDIRLLEYGGGPFSQYSYMARFQNNQLTSYEQTWTIERFNSIKINAFSKQDVLQLVGHPTEVTYYARSPYEVWNYGFKESGAWNSMMSIYFDDAGIVRKMENGPDFRFEEMNYPF